MSGAGIGGRWLGPVRGPVAVAMGEGPWDALGAGLGALGYRVLVLGDADPEDALGEDGPEEVTLIGQGHGAVAATAFASAHPDRVKRLILIAARGVEAPRPAAAAPSRLRSLPFVGRWIAARVAAMAPGPERTLEAEHRSLPRAGVPVVALWAGRDAVVPLRAMGTLAAWNRGAKQEVIEGAGHDLMETHADAIVAALRDVLREDWAG